MIGLSVSKCCAAMAKGEVDPASVQRIVARTACTSDAAWERVLRSYRGDAWGRDHKAEASRIAMEFWHAGKIVQPRLADGTMPDIKATGIWVDSEDQIVYVPYSY